jgi:hypothetical protein
MLELHLPALIGTARHPDSQKNGINLLFFENRLHWQFEVRLLLFTVFTCVWNFRLCLIWVLEAIPKCCTWSYNRWFLGTLVCRILLKFTQKAKPVRITGCLDNQRPDKWSYTVIHNEINVTMDCNQTREYTIK